ncbi:MAG TPA: hypothetical protein VKW70_07400 [Terriglobia bacterium]|nr:hypothetical protein [Terriglobia bacterium]
MGAATENRQLLTDDEFLRGFEECVIVPFHHRDHIRAAWLYLRRQGYEQATISMLESIKRFARHHNVERMYHKTMTLAWMRLVQHALEQSPLENNFDAFAMAHPRLLDKRLIESFYSPELLATETARTGWVPPDRQSLP